MANYDKSKRRPTTHCRPYSSFRRLSVILSLLLCCYYGFVVYGESNEDGAFNPYQLNGGLVAAVAGRDYVLIATDTRLTGETGYDILHRRHVQSRLWTTTTTTTTTTAASAATATATTPTATASATPPQSPVSSDKKEDMTTTTTTRKNVVVQQVLGSDGSLLLPDEDANDAEGVGVGSSPSITATASTTIGGGVLVVPRWMIGSAGCSADCEALKRTIRAEMRVWQAHHPQQHHQQQQQQQQDVASMAVLLSQVLYGRRGFPFYSFCVLAGLPSRGGGGGGCVYAYDAIGSFERVAIASSGTGRSLLQPILDGQFATKSTLSLQSSSLSKPAVSVAVSVKTPIGDDVSNNQESSDSEETALDKQDHQNEEAMILEQEVEDEDSGLVVECSAEEASRILIQAYRAVSEREISVGDYVVICCLRRRREDDDSSIENEQEQLECQVQVEPLKRH